ncbi:MAG: response regulator [Leptolyngbyaceae cyanobacterium bins.59]|nr:response regulator [Leptolyngbyaceae cyanobacterium bins.59]
MLVIEESNHFAGVQVDRGWGEQEVTVRQVEGMIPLPRGFAGCTILGNGRVVPLVDGAMLLQRIRAAQETENTQGRSTAKPALAPASVSPKFTEPSQQIPTVLVIDDSVVVRRFLALTLEKAGYRVEQAKDGQEALDKLLGGLKVQAITCDVEMPRLDGYGFLERLKAEPRLKHIPVSMITSRSGQKHRDLAMNLGASAYFSKPYQEQDLLQTLRSQVSHSNGI